MTALISTAASVLQRFVYEPYGNDSVRTAAWGAISDAYGWTYRFQGLRRTSVAVLYDARFRDYIVNLSSWSRRDPLEYVDGNNLYGAYAPLGSGSLDPYGLAADPRKEAGRKALRGSEDELKKRCEDCCKLANKKAACLKTDTEIATAMARTWELHFGKGTQPPPDEVGGYFCWDWADVFYRANRAPDSAKTMCSKKVRIRPKDTKRTTIHFFARFCACTCDDKKQPECCLDIDDGWLNEGEYVHDSKEEWWGGTWEIDPTSQQVPQEYYHIPVERG